MLDLNALTSFIAQMGDEDKNKGVKSLVSSILGGSAPADPPAPADEDTLEAAPAEPEAQSTLPPSAEDIDAAELIVVYFELEEPEERDALFDQIAALHSPLVREFLEAMADEDEDPFVRGAARAELARRGDPGALADIRGDLEDPEELFFFQLAISVLSQLEPEPLYDQLREIWQNKERAPDQRLEAMSNLEALNSGQALKDYTAALESVGGASDIQEDVVEVATLAFVRHSHEPGAQAVTRLRDMVAKSQLDSEERQELEAFLQEGLDLLAS